VRQDKAAKENKATTTAMQKYNRLSRNHPPVVAAAGSVALFAVGAVDE